MQALLSEVRFWRAIQAATSGGTMFQAQERLQDGCRLSVADPQRLCPCYTMRRGFSLRENERLVGRHRVGLRRFGRALEVL